MSGGRPAATLAAAAVLLACACGRSGTGADPIAGPSVEGSWLADSLTGLDFTRASFGLHESASGAITGKVTTVVRGTSSRPPPGDLSGIRRDSAVTLYWSDLQFRGKVTADSMIGTLSSGAGTYPQKLHRWP